MIAIDRIAAIIIRTDDREWCQRHRYAGQRGEAIIPVADVAPISAETFARVPMIRFTFDVADMPRDWKNPNVLLPNTSAHAIERAS